MFRKPRFPLPTIEKVNIEYHLDWLARRFGDVPIRQHSSWSLQSGGLRPFLSASGMDRQGILSLIADRFPFATAGCELVDWDGQAQVPPDPDVILLNPEEQTNPEALISRVACHLARRYLASLHPDQLETAELASLSELLPLYFGWGVFMANMALRTTQYTHGESHFWHHQKYTDSAARHFGVALAYRAWVRHDLPENLARALRPDARVPYLKTLKYLQRTGDSLFDPLRKNSLFVLQQFEQLEPLLDNASDSQTVAVLQRLLDISEPGSLDVDEACGFLFQRLPELLRHPDESVRTLACLAADRFGSASGEVLDGLRDLLSDPDPGIRKEATSSIIYLAPPGQLLARDLVVSLKDNDAKVVETAVKGLVFLQQQDEDVVPELLGLLRRALNLAAGVDPGFLMAALDTVSGDAERHIREYLQYDPEEVDAALGYLRGWREQLARQSPGHE
jgi:hypothetical protein